MKSMERPGRETSTHGSTIIETATEVVHLPRDQAPGFARKEKSARIIRFESDGRQAKASFLILARRSGSLRGTCLVQTFCLSRGQLKPFGCHGLPVFA